MNLMDNEVLVDLGEDLPEFIFKDSFIYLGFADVSKRLC